MKKIVEWAISHNRVILTLLFLISFIGTSSYQNIPKENTPDVTVPMIIIYTHYQGVSPEDSNRLIVNPLYRQMQNIKNIKNIKGHAGYNYGSLILEFFPNFNIKDALIDVRNEVEKAKANMPNDITEPSIKEINLSLFPVLNIVLSANKPPLEMIKIAQNLRQKIQTLNQVLECELVGSDNPNIEIKIKPEIYNNYPISINQLRSKIINNTNAKIGGKIDRQNQSFNIKIKSLINKFHDIENLVIYEEKDKQLKLKDIAELNLIIDDDRFNIATNNGKPVYILTVTKRLGSNVIETVEEVRNLIAEEKKYLPNDLEIVFTADDSEKIYDMLNDLINNVIIAAILVLFPVLLAIGWRSSLLVTTALPGSFLITFGLFNYLGLSVNLVVLFSMILSIGLLVDAAIVICEYADYLQHNKLVKNYKEAFIQSCGRMAGPVISSAATTIIVFCPLLFWPGITGQFIRYLPITLIITLGSSLVMGFVFIPVLGSIDYKYKFLQQNYSGKFAEFINRYSNKYAKILSKALIKPGRVCLILIFTTICSFGLFASFGKGIEFFPNIEADKIKLNLHAKGNISNKQKDQMINKVNKLLEVYNQKANNIKYYTLQPFSRSSAASDKIAEFTLELQKWQQRDESSIIIKDLQQLFIKNLYGFYVSVMAEKGGPQQGKPVELQISSFKSDLLDTYFVKIWDFLNNYPKLRDLEQNKSQPEIEYVYTIDRFKASYHNLSANDVANAVQLVSDGIRLHDYDIAEFDGKLDIKLRLPPEYRYNKFIEYLSVSNSRRQIIPIIEIANNTPQIKQPSINSKDGMTSFTIKSDVTQGENVNQVIAELKEKLQKMHLPADLKLEFIGDQEEQAETSEFLKKAFFLALGGMLLILLIQFNSMFYSLVIMSAVFFSTFGVFLGLLISGYAFSIVMCGIGVITLAGTVVNHNIILIDNIIKYENEANSLDQILVNACKQRFRPILLTTITAILALLPMIFKINVNILEFTLEYNSPSSQWWTQLSISIASGMIFATMVTLFFTPCFIMWWRNKLNSK